MYGHLYFKTENFEQASFSMCAPQLLSRTYRKVEYANHFEMRHPQLSGTYFKPLPDNEQYSTIIIVVNYMYIQLNVTM